MKRLSEFEIGEVGCVSSIELDAAQTERLNALALVPGCCVRLLNVAPFGDPLLVRVGSTTLSLRRNTACGIIAREGQTTEGEE